MTSMTIPANRDLPVFDTTLMSALFRVNTYINIIQKNIAVDLLSDTP